MRVLRLGLDRKQYNYAWQVSWLNTLCKVAMTFYQLQSAFSKKNTLLLQGGKDIGQNTHKNLVMATFLNEAI